MILPAILGSKLFNALLTFQLQAEEGTIRHKVYTEKLKDNPEGFLSYKECAEKVLSNKQSLYFGNLLDIKAFDTKDRLIQHHIKEKRMLYISFSFPKDSELKSFFSFYTLKLIETGVMRHLFDHWISRPRQQAEEPPGPLPLNSVFFPFFCIVLAAIVSGIIAGAEYCYRKQKERKINP